MPSRFISASLALWPLSSGCAPSCVSANVVSGFNARSIRRSVSGFTSASSGTAGVHAAKQASSKHTIHPILLYPSIHASPFAAYLKSTSVNENDTSYVVKMSAVDRNENVNSFICHGVQIRWKPPYPVPRRSRSAVRHGAALQSASPMQGPDPHFRCSGCAICPPGRTARSPGR